MVDIFSTSPDCLAENVLVVPIVVAELELGDVEGHVFFADLMKRTDDPTLKDRPETFNRLSVDRTDYVLPARVIDACERVFGGELVVTQPTCRRREG